MASLATRVFSYRTLPVAILVFISYISIFISLSVTDTLEDVPKNSKWGGLDIKEAGEDLRAITSHPHPYNSHANDAVRSYLLKRLQSIAANYSHVHIADDMSSNAIWANSNSGVYFEGTNILVKVDGLGESDHADFAESKMRHPGADEDSILISAHYDSVSTAPGATDDGMGIATILQLVKYFAQRQGKKSVIFNLNNGEEDWLNGAHAFMEHPWSNLTHTFLNLEGAAAGGRPILFRATSTTPVRSFQSHAFIPHPHANVLSSDAFSRGVIKSGTDYSVYVDGGMEGLDLAFYKGRSRYHTKYDSVAYTLGGEKSLWSMMQVARGVGVGLVGSPTLGGKVERNPTDKGGREVKVESLGEKTGDAPVYFDLFKAIIIVFPLSKLLTYNIVTLIIGPILLIFLIVVEKVILDRKDEDDDSSSDDSSDEDEVLPGQGGGYGATGSSHRYASNGNGAGNGYRAPVRSNTAGGYDISGALSEDDDADSDDSSVRRRRWASMLGKTWMCVKFWVGLVGCVLVLGGWVWLYKAVNPFAIYSSPYLIFLSAVSLSYLVQTHILAIPFKPTPSLLKPHHLTPHQQSKHVSFHALYIFTWVFLLLSTLGITNLNPGIASGYLVTVWNTLVGIACVSCALESWVGVVRGVHHGLQRDEGELYDELEGAEGTRRRVHAPGAVVRDERAPLLRVERHHPSPYHAHASPSLSHSHSQSEAGRKAAEKEWEGLDSVWWIFEFLISVPMPIILFGSVAMVVLDGMPQGIVDGGTVWGVYIITAFFSLLIVLPLSPFSSKLAPCRSLTYFIIGLFIISTLTTLLSFPFTVEDPLKVFFQQKIQLTGDVVKVRSVYNNSTSSSIPIPPPPASGIITTSLSGPKQYLRDRIVGVMPSAQHEIRKRDGTRVKCVDDEIKKGLERCEWIVEEHMGLDTGDHYDTINATELVGRNVERKEVGRKVWGPSEYFEAEVVRTGPSNATFRVRGRNTRNCRIYFDTGPVFWFGVRGTKGKKDGARKEMQKGYPVPPNGLKEVRLWGRDWEKEWIVDVDWGYQIQGGSEGLERLDGGDSVVNGMMGRIGCEWAEYESGMVDTGPGAKGVRKSHPKIPAYEEVLSFLPEWAAATKYADGLVEVWAPFEV